MIEFADKEGYHNLKKEIQILDDFLNKVLYDKYKRPDVFYYLRKIIL